MYFPRMGLLLFLLTACTSLSIDNAPSQEGINAYNHKDYTLAWTLLSPLADRGHYRAQRYMAFMLLEGNAPIEITENARTLKAIDLLIDAARRGDNHALIILETMRANHASYAPKDQQILDIEIKRASAGDPLTAWRLAKRYEQGDGVTPSRAETIRWLKVVAKTDLKKFPHAHDAAYRLCELYAVEVKLDNDRLGKLTPISSRPTHVTPKRLRLRNMNRAKTWCKNAMRQGHTAAAVTLTRLSASKR